MKVSIIGTNGLPASYGGFETMINHLVQNTVGVKFNIYCPRTPKSKRHKDYYGTRLIYLPFKANGAQSIIYDIISIIHAWFISDVLLILGTPGCIILPLRFLFPRKKIIVNFGGLEWKREKWSSSVKKYLKFTERLAVKHADYIVADNMAFVNYIKNEYDVNAVLIEYGSDHALKQININNMSYSEFPFLGNPYFVSVSRAQEDNNLHILLEAFSKTPDKVLVLISNWNSSEYGKNLKAKYSNYQNLYLIGPFYDQEKLDLIRGNAEVYIHSHKYCGTAPSLVEAMHLGLPIISYNVDTNIFTTESKALYFNTPNDIIEILNTKSKSELISNSYSMKDIADRRYKWSTIANKYKKLYYS